MTSISATGPTNSEFNDDQPYDTVIRGSLNDRPHDPSHYSADSPMWPHRRPGRDYVPVVTFSQDGYLWFVGADSTDCLSPAARPCGNVVILLGPAGDTVLFADGTVIGVGLDRGPLPDVAASLTWTRPTETSTIHVATDGSLRKVSNDGASSSTLSPLTSHTSVPITRTAPPFAVAGVDDPDPSSTPIEGSGSPRTTAQNSGLLESGDPGVVITEMTFSNDARFLMYVADHTADAFDDGYHLHYRFVRTRKHRRYDGANRNGGGHRHQHCQ